MTTTPRPDDESVAGEEDPGAALEELRPDSAMAPKEPKEPKTPPAPPVDPHPPADGNG